jgi:hypothetical protein
MAGFLPIVAVFEPNLNGGMTRTNTFALPGASLVVVSAIGVAAALLNSSRRAMQTFILAGVLPPLLLGLVTQVRVHLAARTAWDEQVQIWNELFALAPNIREGTKVYFVLPGYQDRWSFATWGRMPLTFDWDVSSALNLLYGNNSLKVAPDFIVLDDGDSLYGAVLFPDLQDPTLNYIELAPDGILNHRDGSVTPYDRALFLAFDGNPRHLRLIEDLRAELLVRWPTPGYSPSDHLIQFPLPDAEYRWLVRTR